MAETAKSKSSLTVRIDTDILNMIDQICIEETEKTGFDIDRSDIMRKALTDYIKQHKANK
jgi:metal-responsive CopG/Arc/MetJ family transcriptional regulator